MKTSTKIARHLSRNGFDYDEATQQYHYQVNIDGIDVALNLLEDAEGGQLHYHINGDSVGYFSGYFCSYDLGLAGVVRIVKDLVNRFQRETE